MPSKTLPVLIAEFESLTRHVLDLPDDYKVALESLCLHLDKNQLRSSAERRRWLFARINEKFRFNRDAIAAVYAAAARHRVTFNYHEKCAIQLAFDLRDRDAFVRALRDAEVEEQLRDTLLILFAPIADEETIRLFAIEVDDPSKLRREKGDRRIDQEILLSAFSAFVFSAAEERVLHAFFDNSYEIEKYEESFWVQLRRMYPHLYTRSRSLDIVTISPDETKTSATYEMLRDRVLSIAEESYRELNNHGHLAVWIPPLWLSGRNVTWELASDLILFAEKHDEVVLRNTYFRHGDIAKQTSAYIAGIDQEAANFPLANEGFTYRDTFVCAPDANAKNGEESLLVLFQKNKRDETLIPCPACRSHNVHGNSYSSLGVRSWECRNILCPDRSKYNRGKRYSFKALLMQEAIDDLHNEIPIDSVRSWSRDIQIGKSRNEVVEMLIRHYSLYRDTVYLIGADADVREWGRRLVSIPFPERVSERVAQFFSSAWFNRYIIDDEAHHLGACHEKRRGSLRLVHGEASTALKAFQDGYFDGAVTSPPYYNAREYAQWNNIYCYLYDMYNIARECFRVLKPGAPYLYNIFDYFDNEKSTVFSAMGDKRLILSAYTVDIFRRCGFVIAGSVTWDKGDIEGKRGFNAGNFSPYYQSPFNCWEHVLVFYKPPIPQEVLGIPSVLRAQPVIKMINGENVHGHTAPFPADIPLLLNSLIPAGGCVLDPFGGSATTARALAGSHREVVCIERSEEYCALAMKMFAEAYPEATDIDATDGGRLTNITRRPEAAQFTLFEK